LAPAAKEWFSQIPWVALRASIGILQKNWDTIPTVSTKLLRQDSNHDPALIIASGRNAELLLLWRQFAVSDTRGCGTSSTFSNCRGVKRFFSIARITSMGSRVFIRKIAADDTGDQSKFIVQVSNQRDRH
jgi:hypothetical protein